MNVRGIVDLKVIQGSIQSLIVELKIQFNSMDYILNSMNSKFAFLLDLDSHILNRLIYFVKLSSIKFNTTDIA